MIGRRGFITGLVSLVAAPAIVRAGSLMPVKMVEFEFSSTELYGISPAMQALPMIERDYLERLFKLLLEHPHAT